MKLKKITLENVGPFRKAELYLEDGYNVLIGPNDAGKSVLLDVIESLCWSKTLPHERIHHGSSDFQIRGEFGDGTDCEISTGANKAGGPRLRVIRPEVGVRCPVEANVFNSKSWGPLGGVISSALRELKITPEYWQRSNETKRHGARRLEDHLNNLIQTRFPEFPWVFDLSPVKDNNVALLVNSEDDGGLSNPEQRGSGFHAILNVVSAVLANPNAHVMLFDEPETSLHPQAQKALRDFLSALTTDTEGRQVIVATHSPHFLDATFLPGVSLVRQSEQGSFVKNKPGSGNEWITALAEVRDVIGLTLADTLILNDFLVLVEGATEERFLLSMLKEFGKVDTTRWRPIAVSTSNSRAIAQVLNAIGIPFIGVFDEDAAGDTYAQHLKSIDPQIKVFQWPCGEIEGLFAQQDYLRAVATAFEVDVEEYSPLSDGKSSFSKQVLNWLVTKRPDLRLGKPDLFRAALKHAEPDQKIIDQLSQFFRESNKTLNQYP